LQLAVLPFLNKKLHDIEKIIRTFSGSHRYSSWFAESIQTLAQQRFGNQTLQRFSEQAGSWYEYYELLEAATEVALIALPIKTAAEAHNNALGTFAEAYARQGKHQASLDTRQFARGKEARRTIAD
jgi:hypothetical protein